MRRASVAAVAVNVTFMLLTGSAEAQQVISGNLIVQAGTSDQTLWAPVVVQTGSASYVVSGNLTIPGKAQGAACTLLAAPFSPGGQCNSEYCVDGYCCNNGCQHDMCGGCNGGDLKWTGAVNGTCAAAPSTTTCRASAGVCDLAETCSGSSITCGADLKSTAVCRAATNPYCDYAESCDGFHNTCPADVWAEAQTPCDDGNGCTYNDRCDGNKSCAGTTKTCPANTGCISYTMVCDGTPYCTPSYVAAGTSCTAPSNLASCVASVAPAGTRCDGNGACL